VWLGQQASPFSLTKSELKYVETGLRDFVQGNKITVDPQQYGPKVNEFLRARMQAKAAVEKKKSDDYLSKAAKDKSFTKTASGLLYSVEKSGNGSKPKATDKVRVNYEGRLVDGKVFDSSYARGTPAEFTLNQIIPCWSEALQLMKVGSKAKLVCPPDLAYKDRGFPPSIPPQAVLLFDIELLDILK
jgi:FKBP-type peptidyl-prolyl cis-trans isomerase